MSPSIDFPDDFPIINTERLTLKTFSPKDVDNFFNLRSDEDFMMYLGLHPLKKKSAARDRIRDIIQDFNSAEGLSWKIALKGEDELIGYIGFWTISYRHFRAEIGFGLDEKFQHKGLMSEAMEAVVNYGFETLGLHSIKADVDPNNESSIQLLLANNFKKEAHLRESYYFDGGFLDSAYYCIIKSDWEK